MPDHLYTIHNRLVARADKESLLGQRGQVLWLYGLSGSGKSTIAVALERELHNAGRLVKVLDGDNVRSGLNKNLGFSDDDRQENIRRFAEVAKLFADAGVIVIVSVITPKAELRDIARNVISEHDLTLAYVKASFATCQQRDPKGLYAKVAAGQVKQFTGKDSGFEEPPATSSDVIIDTEQSPLEACVAQAKALIRS